MRGEGFQRVEFALQRFLGKQRVNVVVAGPAEPRDALLHVGAVEVALVPLVRMTCPRDQMMAHQDAGLPSAKLAMCGLAHDPIILETDQVAKATIRHSAFRVLHSMGPRAARTPWEFCSRA